MAVSLHLALPDASPTQRGSGSFKLTALDHYREPLPGAAITVTLEASPGMLEADDARGPSVRLLTDTSGTAAFQWSPSIPPEAAAKDAVHVIVASDHPDAIDLIVEPVVEVFWI